MQGRGGAARPAPAAGPRQGRGKGVCGRICTCVCTRTCVGARTERDTDPTETLTRPVAVLKSEREDAHSGGQPGTPRSPASPRVTSARGQRRVSRTSVTGKDGWMCRREDVRQWRAEHDGTPRWPASSARRGAPPPSSPVLNPPHGPSVRTHLPRLQSGDPGLPRPAPPRPSCPQLRSPPRAEGQ